MYDSFTGIDIVSGGVLSGKEVYGEIITGVVNTGLNVGDYFNSGLVSSPSSFWSWLWGIIKSVLLWCRGYWYVPCIIIVVYVIILVGYNKLWGYLLSRLQKKGN